jgi:hypothetical protein
VHAWALSSNHNAKQFILIRCKHSQRAARSFVRGLEIRLKNIGLFQKRSPLPPQRKFLLSRGGWKQNLFLMIVSVLRFSKE